MGGNQVEGRGGVEVFLLVAQEGLKAHDVIRVPYVQYVGSNMQSVRAFQYRQKQATRIFQYKLFIQSVGVFQYKIISQGYSSTKHSVSRDIPVQNIQPVRIFQYKLFT